MNAKCQIFVVYILVIGGLFVPRIQAERLAVHTFTVADGLAGDQVMCLTRDRQGFLWIGTSTGLSRFDGISFRFFDIGDGLPAAGVFAILEAADGTLWFGTGGGLVRMLEERNDQGSAFEAAVGIPGGVGALVEDEAGALWAASAGVLYRRESSHGVSFAAVKTNIPWLPGYAHSIGTMETAVGGGLWLGTNIGLFRLMPGGAIVPLVFDGQEYPWRVTSLFGDSAGRLWVAGRGVTVFKPHVKPAEQTAIADVRRDLAKPGFAPVLPDEPGAALHLGFDPGSTDNVIFGVDEGRDGTVWVASHQGLIAIDPNGIVVHSRHSGLVSDHLGPILVDEAGNLWIGTQSHGLMRVNFNGFTSFTEEDGLLDRQTASVTLGPSREIVVVGFPPEDVIHIRDGETFIPLKISLPKDFRRFGWGLNQVTFFDHQGQLWVPTPDGLFRFPPLATVLDLPQTRHEQRYLQGFEVFRLFEDSRGDIWMGVFGDYRLVRWERSTDSLHRYDDDDGIPYHSGTAFAEDRSGAVWIGFYSGGVARWRNEAFTRFDRDDGLPAGLVNCMLIDHRGRLWVGGNADGLAVTDDPTVDDPEWRFLTSADGLVSEAVFSLAEDRFGRIYAGSLKGVDRIDPETGRVDHFDTSTGLVNNLVLDAIEGPDGDIWFATDGGVSRYRPTQEWRREVPPVVVDRVTIDGDDLTVPLRGVVAIPQILLPSDTAVVDVGFAAVDLVPGSRLVYEVAVGPDAQTWSLIRGERFVRLAGLSFGKHRILIRARLPDGSVGAPATVDLYIATPFWRQWWFLVSMAVSVVAAAWLVQRWRLQRLLELHNVRSRIAADLHDEMGLSLARVAILADVAGQEFEGSATSSTLREIGSTARDLVDATSDMAWALDPRHDTLAALVARFRRVAGEVVEGSGGRFLFDADSLEGVPMASEARRHLLLILKEAVRNACSHGAPDQVALTVRCSASRIVITLEDDGVGFDTGIDGDGQGLLSMRRRAVEMGARLEISSTRGAGTRITLIIPVGKSA